MSSTSLNRIRVAAAVVIVLVGAIFFALDRFGAGDGPQQAEPVSNLERWGEVTSRPGFRLLDQADLPDYFVTVYETDAGEVAFCYRWKHGAGGPDTRSFVVRDTDGQNLQDAERLSATTELNATGAIPAHMYVDGMVVPIRADHGSEIVLEFRDNPEGGLPTRPVYEKTLRLGAGGTAADETR